VAREIVNSHRGTLSIAPESPRGTKAVIHSPFLVMNMSKPRARPDRRDNVEMARSLADG